MRARKGQVLILWLCVAQFGFSYATGAVEERIPARRIAVSQQIAKIPGKLLVFVRYWPNHIFQDEWVYNAADIDGARVVWARDLGEPEDEQLRKILSGSGGVAAGTGCGAASAWAL